VIGQHRAPAALYPRYTFYRRLGGPQGRSGRAENLVPTGIRSRTIQAVANRYTDWATRSTIYIKAKWSRYRPGVAQKLSRVIALLFHDRGTRRGWVVSSTPRPHFTPGKDPVPILEEAGWAPGSVWTGGKSRPHQVSIPDRPARSQSLYRLSYRAHTQHMIKSKRRKLHLKTRFNHPEQETYVMTCERQVPSNKTHFISTAKTNRLMMSRKMIAVL